MSDFDAKKQQCIDNINSLFQKYTNNPYMIQRICNHVINYLPNTLDNELTNHEKRQNRTSYLTQEQHTFIQIFLSKNKYYYLANCNTFYEYNGLNYFIIREDDIIHKLLSSISKDRVLMEWKYKTKINIIKQIKERSLFISTPETDTIQSVLNTLYPSIFSSKNFAKYFLTIIGDNILKKTSSNLFLVSPQMRQFLNEIDNISSLSIGHNYISSNFITKYHENHSYENYRLIRINDNYCNQFWRETLKKIGLDLLCVAVHYSTRYESSDKYVDLKYDDELKNYVYYLKNNNQDAIIQEFANKYIVGVNMLESKNDCKIEWKNMHFLWKQFLLNNHLPNVIYSNTLKNILKQKFVNYDEATDSFCQLTSKYLPIHKDFIVFWEENIKVISNCVEDDDICLDEIEIDELCSLYKVWAREKGLSNYNITDETVVRILTHFFPSVEIIDNKYILNVKCDIWDSFSNITQIMPTILVEIKKMMESKKDCKLPLVSFDEIYNAYQQYCKKNLGTIKFVVSKRYFEKILYKFYKNNVVYDKFIEILNVAI